MDNPPSTSQFNTSLRRVGWLILIWACSVAALGVVALVMRLLMSWAGMTR